MKKKRFTLCEFLVVIAIIMILGAMLLPALSKVREKAKTIKCMLNLNNFSKASLMYAGDYEGYYVEWRIWPRSLFQYLNSVPVYNCPAKVRGGTKSGTSISAVDVASQHYAMNVFLFTKEADLNMGTTGMNPKYGLVKNPSMKFLMADVEWVNTSGVEMGGFLYFQHRKGYPFGNNYYYQYSLSIRHGNNPVTGGSNFIFMDGHVSFMRRIEADNNWGTPQTANRWRIWF